MGILHEKTFTFVRRQGGLFFPAAIGNENLVLKCLQFIIKLMIPLKSVSCIELFPEYPSGGKYALAICQGVDAHRVAVVFFHEGIAYLCCFSISLRTLLHTLSGHGRGCFAAVSCIAVHALFAPRLLHIPCVGHCNKFAVLQRLHTAGAGTLDKTLLYILMCTVFASFSANCSKPDFAISTASQAFSQFVLSFSVKTSARLAMMLKVYISAGIICFQYRITLLIEDHLLKQTINSN